MRHLRLIWRLRNVKLRLPFLRCASYIIHGRQGAPDIIALSQWGLPASRISVAFLFDIRWLDQQINTADVTQNDLFLRATTDCCWLVVAVRRVICECSIKPHISNKSEMIHTKNRQSSPSRTSQPINIDHRSADRADWLDACTKTTTDRDHSMPYYYCMYVWDAYPCGNCNSGRNWTGQRFKEEQHGWRRFCNSIHSQYC